MLIFIEIKINAMSIFIEIKINAMSIFIGNKCPHIPKAVNFNKIKKCISKMGISIECSICKKCKNSSKIDDEV